MMRVKFLNGVVKECSAPTEQKLFRTSDTKTVGVGWVLILRLAGSITSSEIDSVLAPENIGTLEFSTVNENGEEKMLFSLSGYERLTSSTIRYSENDADTFAEIQLSKGV